MDRIALTARQAWSGLQQGSPSARKQSASRGQPRQADSLRDAAYGPVPRRPAVLCPRFGLSQIARLSAFVQ